MWWGYGQERHSKFQWIIQTVIIVQTAVHIHTTLEILLNMSECHSQAVLLGGLPGWSYSQWSGYPGRAAHHRTAPAGICLRRPQSKRPGKEADIWGESRAGTFPPDQGPKVGVALTTTVGLDVSCLTSHTPAPSQQTSDRTRLGSQTPRSVEAGRRHTVKRGGEGWPTF